VWILDADGKPKAVALTLGISDGTATEVLRGDLTEGQEIITGLATAGQNRSGTPGGSAPAGPRLRL
jgi:HlyD family secretion protein